MIKNEIFDNLGTGVIDRFGLFLYDEYVTSSGMS